MHFGQLYCQLVLVAEVQIIGPGSNTQQTNICSADKLQLFGLFYTPNNDFDILCIEDMLE